MTTSLTGSGAFTGEGKLLGAVDAGVLTTDDAEDDQLQDGNVLLDAECLLLLGLAYTNPNMSSHPSMVKAAQVSANAGGSS